MFHLYHIPIGLAMYPYPRRRIRADSRFAPSQWETALLCNDVSHWLGTGLESALRMHTWLVEWEYVNSDTLSFFYCFLQHILEYTTSVITHVFQIVHVSTEDGRDQPYASHSSLGWHHGSPRDKWLMPVFTWLNWKQRDHFKIQLGTTLIRFHKAGQPKVQHY